MAVCLLLVVFLNYSIPIKAKTAKIFKMAENLENQATIAEFSFSGFKHRRVHVHMQSPGKTDTTS